jgi:hypothetical protein
MKIIIDSIENTFTRQYRRAADVDEPYSHAHYVPIPLHAYIAENHCRHTEFNIMSSCSNTLWIYWSALQMRTAKCTQTDYPYFLL